jgi:hypothetical protein
MKNTIIILLYMSLISSCIPLYHYFPSYSSIPDFQSKNELQIDGTIGDISRSLNLRNPENGPFCFDFQIAYSLTNNIFIGYQAIYDRQIKSSPIQFLQSNINSNTIEDRISYKTNGVHAGWLNRSTKFIWGFKTGINTGQINLNYIDKNEPATDRVDFHADYNAISLAPFGAYEANYCQVAIQMNIVKSNYSSVDNKLLLLTDNKNFEPFVSINKPFNQYLFEPSVTLKAGSKNAKIVIQEILSYNIGNEKINNMRSIFFIGFEFKLDINKIVNFIKLKK